MPHSTVHCFSYANAALCRAEEIAINQLSIGQLEEKKDRERKRGPLFPPSSSSSSSSPPLLPSGLEGPGKAWKLDPDPDLESRWRAGGRSGAKQKKKKKVSYSLFLCPHDELSV